MGFSSALIGSAMAFDFAIFHEIAPTMKGGDTSTAMEVSLLKQNIYTEYLEEVICYSRKEDSDEQYVNRRAQWTKGRYYTRRYALLHLPLAMLSGEWDLANKYFQWTIPSRFTLIALIALISIIMTVADWMLCIKWYVLLVILFFVFIMALPDGEISRRFRHAIWIMPYLVAKSFFSLFKSKVRKNRSKKKKKQKTEDTPNKESIIQNEIL